MYKVYIAVVTIIVLFGINIFLAVKNANYDVTAIQLIPGYSAEDKDQQAPSTGSGQAYILPISEPNYIPILDSNAAKPVINAKSAVVFDIRSGRFLYENNGKTKLPVASLTKIMSAVVVLKRLDLEDIVTISSESIKVDGEKQDLYLGEKMSVRNLLKLMLIESSNDAAYALVAHAKSKGVDFIEAMNAKARVLNMADTYFNDPAGLDDTAYSTGKDLVKLVQYSLNYPEIWDISAEKTAIIESSDERIKHRVYSTNRLLGILQDIIGGKTGYTEGAGQCMILVTNVPDYPSKIVSIVLGSYDRFGDTQKLIDWTRRAYKWR